MSINKFVPLPSITRRSLCNDLLDGAALFRSEVLPPVDQLIAALEGIILKSSDGIQVDEYEPITAVLQGIVEHDELSASPEFVSTAC